jgi:hypothetical protein
MAVSRHDQQSVALTYASAGATGCDYHALDLIGSEVLPRSGRLIGLADRRSIAPLCPFRCLGEVNYSGDFTDSFDGLARLNCP